jgi:hypothetical protein
MSGGRPDPLRGRRQVTRGIRPARQWLLCYSRSSQPRLRIEFVWSWSRSILFTLDRRQIIHCVGLSIVPITTVRGAWCARSGARLGALVRARGSAPLIPSCRKRSYGGNEAEPIRQPRDRNKGSRRSVSIAMSQAARRLPPARRSQTQHRSRQVAPATPTFSSWKPEHAVPASMRS